MRSHVRHYGLGLGIIMIFLANHAAGSNSAVAKHRLILTGQATATWFGLRIYSASLWTRSGVFQGFKQGPVALHIVYHRHIARDDLVDTTVKEWRRLGISSPEKRRSWAERVSRIWPNVTPGDAITTVVDDRQTVFYSGDEKLGVVDDPGFGPDFLAIWLHPQSKLKELRSSHSGYSRGDSLAHAGRPAQHKALD